MRTRETLALALLQEQLLSTMASYRTTTNLWVTSWEPNSKRAK